MRIILVLGNKSLPSGEASGIFKERMAEAVRRMKEDPQCWLIISGGITRKGCVSEADLGLTLVPLPLRHRVQLEREASSTTENMTCTRKMLAGMRIDELLIITSAYHVPRARLLLKKYWPSMIQKASFVGVGESNWILKAKEFLLRCLVTLDPDEQVVMPILRAFK